MNESCRVSIEVVEEIDEGRFNISRHESGSVGDRDVGVRIAECLNAIGGRNYSKLAEAIEHIAFNDLEDKDGFPDPTALIQAAKDYLRAWQKRDTDTTPVNA